MIGALLRGFYLSEIADRPGFSTPIVDAGFHDYWARGLATGDWTPPFNTSDPGIGDTPYVRPPGYPYFLAIIYSVVGLGPIAPRVVQMVLGLLNCVLAFTIGRRWYGRGTGLTWAGMMSVYWAFIYFEGELHAVVLSVFLLLSIVYVLGNWTERMVWPYAAGAGVLTGLAALVRPNALVLLVVVPLWMVVTARRRGVRRRGLTAAAFVLATLLAISPATIRNYLVARDFVFISANGGVNLFIGNNEEATGRCMSALPGIGRFDTCFDYPAIVAELEQREGRRLKYSEVSASFRNLATNFIKDNPGDFLRLTLRKAIWFWGPTEIGHNKEVHYERQFSRVLSRLPGDFSTVLALTLAGGAVCLVTRGAHREGNGEEGGVRKRHTDMSVLMALVVLGLFTSVLPFFVAARYRVPVTPFLLFFAACGICSVVRLIVARRGLPVLCWAVVCVAASLLLHLPGLSAEPNLSRWYYDQGLDYEREDDLARALEYYEKSIEAEPLGPQARLAAARLLRRQGKTAEAAVHLRRTLQYVHPYVAEAHQELARVLLDEGEIDQAVVHYRESLRSRSGDVAVRMELAQVLEEAGRTQEAISEYELVLVAHPDNTEALFRLGVALHEAGRSQDALPYLQRAVQQEPARRGLLESMGIPVNNLPTAAPAASPTTSPEPSEDELLRRADRLAEVGRTAEALELYEQALVLRPDDAIIHFKAGGLLASTGRFEQALRHYHRAIEVHPRFAAAHNALGMAYGRLNDAESAARHYQMAVDIDPNMYAAHYNLGIVLGDGLGRYDEAIEALGRALSLVQSAGRTDLAERISERIERFRGYQREDDGGDSGSVPRRP